MKTIIILLVATFATCATFAQKSKANDTTTKSLVGTVQYSCPMHPEVVSYHEGICAKCRSKLVVERRSSKQGVTVYTCSMHPQVASNEPRKCPICGQPLEKQNSTADSTKAKS